MIARRWPVRLPGIACVAVLAGLSLSFPFSSSGLNFAAGLEARPREVIRIELRGHRLDVETARTPEARERGLRYRSRLCNTCGMLFVYPRADRRSFHTRDVFMALDVAYFGDDRRLLELRTMPANGVGPGSQSGEKTAPEFPAREAFRYALAVPAGWFARHGIGRHIVLELPHDLPAL